MLRGWFECWIPAYAGMTPVIAEPYLGERNSCMPTNNKFISVDEHVQEHPDVWTKRLSAAKWGERIPHVAKNADGKERWLIDGRADSHWPASPIAAR